MVFYRNIKTHSRFVLTHNLSFKFFLLSKLLSDDTGNGVSTCILQALSRFSTRRNFARGAEFFFVL